MFKIDAEVNKRLEFLRRCSKCTHSTLSDNKAKCVPSHTTCLAVYDNIEPVEIFPDRFADKEEFYQAVGYRGKLTLKRICSDFSEPVPFIIK